MFGSLMMFVFGVFIRWFSLVRLLLMCCFLVRCLGKVDRIWLVIEMLWVLMLMLVVLVNEWMIGSSDVLVSLGVLLIMV